jgi:hypothetical protein
MYSSLHVHNPHELEIEQIAIDRSCLNIKSKDGNTFMCVYLSSDQTRKLSDDLNKHLDREIA